MILWAPAPSRKRRPCGVCRPRRAAVRTGRVCMAKCGGRFVDTCTGKTWENCTKWGLNFGDVQNFPNRFIGSPLHQFSQDFRFQKICRPAMPCTSVTSRATGGGSRGSRGHSGTRRGAARGSRGSGRGSRPVAATRGTATVRLARKGTSGAWEIWEHILRDCCPFFQVEISHLIPSSLRCWYPHVSTSVQH